MKIENRELLFDLRTTAIDERYKSANKLELPPWFVLQLLLTLIIKELPPNTHPEPVFLSKHWFRA
jgi:hypothetical protein